MKISICIPQFNRIAYLLKSLKIIEEQSYENIEIVVSDDDSSDNTTEEILNLSKVYKYPIIYSKNVPNKGFDYNYRKCIELGTGEYALVIGNDDSLYGKDAIKFLVQFLKRNNFPDVGFCNCIEERTNNSLLKRAHETKVLGTGTEIALKYYSGFSFVGGLIYKKSTFDKLNTDKHDGSVYAQMYLGCLMVAKGNSLFSIQEPLVIKDLLIDNKFRQSYRDTIAKSWKNYKKVRGGLPSVIHVLISSFRDAGVLNQDIIYKIYKRIYSVTFPFWIQDYKSNKALPEAIGLIHGLYPPDTEDFRLLNFSNRFKLIAVYIFSSAAGLLIPNFLFKKLQTKLYQWMKK